MILLITLAFLAVCGFPLGCYFGRWYGQKLVATYMDLCIEDAANYHSSGGATYQYLKHMITAYK